MEGAPVHRNEVTLVGRVSRAPVCKDLPSGDPVTSWGLAVRRPPGHPSNKKSDGIACVAFGTEVAVVVTQWRVDDVVSVEGALHHRFRSAPGGGTSIYEVEVHRARKIEDGRRSRVASSGAQESAIM